MWEWRRSRINRAAHDLPADWGGRPVSKLDSFVQRQSPPQSAGWRHSYVAKRAESRAVLARDSAPLSHLTCGNGSMPVPVCPPGAWGNRRDFPGRHERPQGEPARMGSPGRAAAWARSRSSSGRSSPIRPGSRSTMHRRPARGEPSHPVRVPRATRPTRQGSGKQSPTWVMLRTPGSTSGTGTRPLLDGAGPRLEG